MMIRIPAWGYRIRRRIRRALRSPRTLRIEPALGASDRARRIAVQRSHPRKGYVELACGVTKAKVDDNGRLDVEGWVLSPTEDVEFRIEIDGKSRLSTKVEHAKSLSWRDYPDYGLRLGRYCLQLEAGPAVQAQDVIRVACSTPMTPSLSVATCLPTTLSFQGRGVVNDTPTRRVIVVTHVRPHPVTQGNRVVIQQLSQWLRANGYAVTLVVQVPELSALDDILDALRGDYDRVVLTLSVPADYPSDHERVCEGDLYSPFTETCLLELCDDEEVVAVVAQYVHMASAMRALPSRIQRFVQTIDCLSRLVDIQTEYGISVPSFRLMIPQEEATLLRFSDTVIAIQHVERQLFSELVPDRRVITLGLAAEGHKLHRSGRPDPPIVLYIASNNVMNAPGLRQFVEECWDRIAEREPTAKFHVVGTICEWMKTNLDADELKRRGIVLRGVLSDLDEAYRSATIVVNCTTVGTGLKVKTVDALSRGKAIVATPSAVEGIAIEDETPFEVADSWAEFAERVVDLIGDAARRSGLEQRALAYAARHLNTDRVFLEFKNALAQRTND